MKVKKNWLRRPLHSVATFAILACAQHSANAQLVPITIGGTSGGITPGSSAADGNPNTAWNSGGPAPQWINIDLQQDRIVSRIRMLPSQSPNGYTTHHIWGYTSSNQYVDLGSREGWTYDNQWFEYDVTDTTPIRALVIVTNSGPSWVAWRDFQVYDGGAVTESCTLNPPPGTIVSKTTPGACPGQQPRYQFRNIASPTQPSGVKVRSCISYNIPPGWTLDSQSYIPNGCVGFQEINGASNVLWYKKN